MTKISGRLEFYGRRFPWRVVVSEKMGVNLQPIYEVFFNQLIGKGIAIIDEGCKWSLMRDNTSAFVLDYVTNGNPVLRAKNQNYAKMVRVLEEVLPGNEAAKNKVMKVFSEVSWAQSGTQINLLTSLEFAFFRINGRMVNVLSAPWESLTIEASPKESVYMVHMPTWGVPVRVSLETQKKVCTKGGVRCIFLSETGACQKFTVSSKASLEALGEGRKKKRRIGDCESSTS